MRTLILDPARSGVSQLLERRRRLGLDRSDEVWEGVLHMVPGPSFAHARVIHQVGKLLDGPCLSAGLIPAIGEFNLGESEDDYRIPDGGVHRPGASGVWLPTAAIVVEIVSPGDESWEKLPFYAAHSVDEVLIVDPQTRSISWLTLRDGEYRPVPRSGLIALSADELQQALEWPDIT